ncbi:MAG: SIMPL domain-containing protein [Defluviitaleaceae bacterium]|nr:SIMPL domain-containing protein [Defluviitaleaceae bacterium]
MKKVSCFLSIVLVSIMISTQFIWAGTISTSGAGAVTVEPDIATITFSVTYEHSDSARAAEEVNGIIAEVIDILREFDIEDTDIRTSRINISRLTRWDNVMQRNVLIEFRATNSVTITVRELDILGYLLGAVIETGALVSGNINFESSLASELYYQALEIAMRDARARAGAIARGGDLIITGIQSVNETSAWNAPVARAAAPQMDAAMMFMAEESPVHYVPIMAGEITVTARVSVIFNIVVNEE